MTGTNLKLFSSTSVGPIQLYPAVEPIREHLAFYSDRVDSIEERE